MLSIISSLLKNIVQHGDASPCTFVMNDDGGVIIESSHYPTLGRVEISGLEFQALMLAEQASREELGRNVGMAVQKK